MATRRLVRLWGSTMLLVVIVVLVMRQWPWRGFWYDETVNAYLAERSWAEIWEWCTRIDNQMPLHFLLLKVWGKFAGTSEFALRYVSAACALLAVAGSIGLGRRLGGTIWAGWLAAVALAVTQSFLYAAFEVRPYALLLALLAWASIVLWELWQRYGIKGQRRDQTYGLLLIMYWLLALGLLYTHYTALFALAAHGVVIGVWVLRHRTRRNWLLAGHLAAGILVGYVPWFLALAGRDVRAGTSYVDHIKPGQALQAYVEFWAHGQRFVPRNAPPYEWIMVVVLAGAVVMWIALSHSVQPKRGLAYAVSMVVVPCVGLLLMVYAVQGKLSGRHSWMMWLAAAVLVGVGLGALARFRWVRWPVWFGALLIMWLPSTAQYQPIYNSYVREAIDYINRHAEPGDVLVLRDGTLFTAAQYYGVVLPWIGMPPDKITNVHAPLFLTEAVNGLTEITAPRRVQRVWVLAWQGDVMDPQNLTQGILDVIGEPEPLADAFGFGDITILRYRLTASPDGLSDRVEALQGVVQVPPDGPIYLGGYVVGELAVRRTAVVQLQTWWQRGPATVDDLRVSVRLVDAAGAFYALFDGPPVPETLAQEDWLPGEPVLGRFVLPVPNEMLPGRAELRLVVYDMDGSFEPFSVPVTELIILE